MVDDPDARAGEDAAHLEGCSECRGLFEGISDDARAVATLLAVHDAHVDVAGAFDRMLAAPAAQRRPIFRLPLIRPGRRPVVLAFAAVLAGVALIAAVVAGDLTLNFAPNTVTPVPVTVADMQALSQLSNYGDITWTKQPQLQAAPSATATQVTVKQIEDYVLAQPGITPELKAAVQAIGDPSTTLLIPIPVAYTTSKDVTVQGVKGVALGDNTGVGAGVIWVKNGVVYAVAGSIKVDEAIAIANNLK